MSKIPTISLFLNKEKKNKKGENPIVVRVNFKGNKIRLSTGYSVKESLWNEKKKCTKPQHPYSTQINGSLESFVGEIQQLAQKAQALEKEPLMYISQNLKTGQKTVNHDFFECFDEYVNNHQKTHAKRSLVVYETTLKFLLEFQKKENYPITFDTINGNFLSKFVVFLIDTYQNMRVFNQR